MNGDSRADQVDADEVPDDDLVIAAICSAMALTMVGLVALLFLWR